MRHRPARLCAAVALACSTLATLAAHAETPFDFRTTPGKLPKDVVPVQYDIHLAPNLADDSLRGDETVDIDVLAPTAAIVLNAADLDIDRAALSGPGLDAVALTPQADPAQQTVRFALPRTVAPGRYRLTLAFRGKIGDGGVGMYARRYKVGERDRKLIVTQMEPTGARRMVPSWDEPAFRARFHLAIDLPEKLVAVSNTPIEKQEALGGGLRRTTFAATPPMSSYLLAVAAGEFERIDASQDGVELGVVTTEGKQASARYALDLARQTLSYYNGYFGIPYPLPKLDHIAIGAGLPGAMENWGAIVYKDSALLVDPARGTDATRRLVYTVVVHEMAHQWFGNLVTMAWWDNLWLNEGFASWMEVKAMERFHPEWQPALQAQTEREDMLDHDARRTTHPIQTPVATEEQAANAFDDITYIKGQSFLRMLEDYLGEDAFRKGIRAYMAAHKYGNTTSADLWNALGQASGKPVAKVASAWTTQPGFPVVRVSQACTGGTRTVTLRQERFSVDGQSGDARLWPIPVQATTAGARGAKQSGTQSLLMTGPTATLRMPGCNGAVVLDPASVGLYRVQYDRASAAALTAGLARLPDGVRLRLVADAWALVLADRMSVADYLQLLRRYGAEPRGAVWTAVLNGLSALDTLGAGTPQQARLRRFTVELLRPEFDRLGWDERPGEQSDRRQLRAALIGALGRAGDAEVIAGARQRYAALLRDPAAVAPSLAAAVTDVTAQEADAATLDAMLARLQRSQDGEERNLLAHALGRVRDPALSARALAFTLPADGLHNNTGGMLITDVARNGHDRQAWDFVTAHRDEVPIVGLAGPGFYIAGVVADSADPALADEMEAYVGKHFSADALDEARRVGSGIRLRAAQKARLVAQLRQWQ